MNKMVVGTMGLFLLGASPAFANSLTNSGSEPEVQTSNGIPYVSGGFGLSERTEIRGIGKTDNLELSFALQNKDYIGGAEVRIKEKNGTELLEAVADGPLFFAKLPEGVYIVEATAMGKTGADGACAVQGASATLLRLERFDRKPYAGKK